MADLDPIRIRRRLYLDAVRARRAAMIDSVGGDPIGLSLVYAWASASDVPALIAELEAQRHEVERLRAAVDLHIASPSSRSCFECGLDWPCPTRLTANGEADRV